MVLVAVRNAGGCPNNPTPSPVDLSYMELTPDGRIFSTGLSSYRCMHIIHHPEQKGEACMVEQGAIQLDHYITNLPHFPNFRLGPLDGSACDTLGLNNHPLAGWRYDHTGGKTVDFTSVSWYEPTEWYWDFGDGSVAVTERNPTHTFPATGGYEVCLTVSNAYGSDTKCKKVYITTTSSTGLEDAALRRVLFPNPTTGTLGWKTEGIASIRLYNSLGQMVLEKAVTGQNTDLGNVTNGLYRIQLLDALGGVVSVHSVVVLR
jgi:PKD repeat protein